MFELREPSRQGTSLPLVQITGHHSDESTPTAPNVTARDLGDIYGATREAWPNFDQFANLVDRAVSEARQSDVLLGDRLDTTSPLGKITAGSFGRLKRDQDLYTSFRSSTDDALSWAGVEWEGPDAALQIYGDLLPGGQQVLTLTPVPNGEPFGAMAFSSRTFIAAIPGDEGWGGWDVNITYRSNDSFAAQEEIAILGALSGAMPNQAVHRVLWWRSYTGANTRTTEGIDEEENGSFRPAPPSRHWARGAGVILGRLAWIATKHSPVANGDPTARRRRLHHELARQDTTMACPDIRQVTSELATQNAAHEAVIVIHGTMACGIPAARAVRDVIPSDVPVLRFEHDTWLAIQDNASDLVEEIERLGIRRALLVAHSRGGLVARQTVDTAAKQKLDVQLELVTLGAPFLGTSIAHAARGGLLGIQTMLGLIRGFGGIAVDATTRLAAFMIKRHEPRGIDQMRPDSDYVIGARSQPWSGIAIAGTAPDELDPADSLGLAFTRGFAYELFAGQLNDLVVTTRSALGTPLGADTLNVDSDHFSYYVNQTCLSSIQASALSIKPSGTQTFSRRQSDHSRDRRPLAW